MSTPRCLPASTTFSPPLRGSDRLSATGFRRLWRRAPGRLLVGRHRGQNRARAASCALVLGAAFAFGPSGLALADPAAKPQRIVSINMCIDELVLRLADRERIASVTWLSQDARNANMADAARKFPANHGLAEEVLSYHPDLVLAGAFTTRTTIMLLKRVGMPVVEFGVPETLDGVRQQIREVAAALGEQPRGEALITEMDGRLAALAGKRHPRRLSAIVMRPNGFTVGRGSLVDDIMARAGLDNLAARLGIDSYLQISLEAVALENAEVLILNGESGGLPSLATEALHHPIVTRLAGRLEVVSVPSRLWTCAGPSLVDAIRLLIDATGKPTSPPS